MFTVLGQLRAPLSPLAFAIGPFQVFWYGIIIVLGLVLAYSLARYLQPRFQQLQQLDLADLIPWLIIGGIIGARLYYVAFKLSYFSQYPVEILKIWHGGLAIHGAFLGAIITMLIYLRYHKLNFFSTADLLVAPLILGQALGRWGNFFNEEAFGAPSELPWKLYISPAKRPIGLESDQYFHPTFLYESLWNLVVLALLLVAIYKTKKPGIILGLYLIFYSLGRFFIEGLRLDSLMLGPLRIAQVISVIFILAGLLIIYWQRKAKQAR